MKKISVVIPTHNRLDALQVSLQSLLNQTELPDEVIVVDDGSEQIVPEMIFSDFPKEIRCVLLRNETPKGGNHARNRGIRESRSEYIAFLDDDDKFNSCKLAKLKEFIANEPKVDVIYHSALINMVNEKVSYVTKPKMFSETNNLFRKLLIQNVVGGTPMVTVRREALLKVGLFDESMPALQDYELWLRLAKNGYKFSLLNLPLTECNYLSQKGSVSKSLDKNQKALNLIENKYESEYSTLTKAEMKMHNAWKLRMKVHKNLLNGSVLGAMKYQSQLFILSPNVVNFATLVMLVFGPNVVFKLKAKLS